MNKKIMITGVGVVALVVVTGSGYFFYQQHDKKLQSQAVNQFISGFETKDFETLGKSLREESVEKQGLTKETAIEKYDAIFNGLNITNIISSNTKVEDKSFSVTFNMTTPFGELKNQAYSGKLVKESGTYKIDWNYSLIFPEMKKDDKVYMNTDDPTRGDIIDINKMPLATKHEYPQYGMIPMELGTGEEKANNIQAISKAFDMEESDIEGLLEQSWVNDESFVPIKTVDFNADQSPYEGLTGVISKAVTKRYYPLGEAAAQLIGYTGSVTAEDIEGDSELSGFSDTGKTGLEAQLDKKLRGKAGGKIEIVSKEEEVRKVLVEQKREDGETIRLNIDSSLQKEAFVALNNLAGSTVVTDPSTGALKAVVSSPSYDPNKFILGISQKDYDAYGNNKLNPFLARFATGYAPGSTFKTLTAAIGIDAGITSPEKTHEINGLKWQKDGSWGDYFVTRVSDAVSNVNMNDALIYSDNIYFAMEALEIGQEKYLAGLEKFPFGEKMSVNIPMVGAQISNDDIESEILLADTAYGQGQLLINPIQQAVMYSVLPNKGRVQYPQLIVGKEAKQEDKIISENAANLVTQALIQTVENPNGTAHVLATGNNNIAAKTGTAEIKEKQDTKGQENSFLLAYDANDGKYLVVSMIEDAKDTSAVRQNQALVQGLANQ
ncbi:penicillin-binding transpeptidase domain-containing protein [Lactococcus lactis]|jgi:penicillin-binding protein|uniref:Penicillin-binding transpeptidase domain-containing protein n=1 Tax=Lactococcus lactis TaxID=1358 RepID=A0AAP5UCP4_9LACT|nr:MULTISPECIES: penicillin-binding transpeptidase domain-containing protein [Lactobacillales]MDT2861045.1 penicillin-binding transpeptidase domain-containing protein [Lactococcus lactis]MDT2869203.1 penicillin-binding transpeptidase domain-containing protein [Lactococcus lactis]MDT2871735.1 penicillin-binding transpeptidase domain-containing protein [Lactococcus lactis]MDT2874490.1 penicillin-binding transpeptidase domain-containing protein [Lactococcus lactis]MDT2877089.1 penicillin-binding 